jgi:hypothetical protein
MISAAADEVSGPLRSCSRPMVKVFRWMSPGRRRFTTSLCGR